MTLSKSSKRWLQEHFNDVFVKKARQENYRSRAVYKLKEIDDKYSLISPGMHVLDLGAAPGSWSQYVLQKLNDKGRLIGIDLLPVEPLNGLEFIQGDFEDESILQRLMHLLHNTNLDLLISDISPNMSGNSSIDIPRAMDLMEVVFEFATQTLKIGATLLIKIFYGNGVECFLKRVRLNFSKINIIKPKASRPRSREAYLLARGYNSINMIHHHSN